MDNKNINIMKEPNNNCLVMVRADNLTDLCNEVRSLRNELCKIKAVPTNRIYKNDEIKELLGVKDKLLKKYRDEGKLAYSQVGDKYWYTQSDIDQFLKSNYYAADV